MMLSYSTLNSCEQSNIPEQVPPSSPSAQAHSATLSDTAAADTDTQTAPSQRSGSRNNGNELHTCFLADAVFRSFLGPQARRSRHARFSANLALREPAASVSTPGRPSALNTSTMRGQNTRQLFGARDDDRRQAKTPATPD